MEGLLIIDKPAGLTSHDVIARVRRVLGTRRVGHTGTLDPFATGVMVVLIGGATRVARFLDKDTKEYIADIRFGFETDTGDVDGARSADSGLQIDELRTRLQETDWENILSRFRGEIMQTPPMYSAKKVDGKKLYELARQGKEIERVPARVSIYELELLYEEVNDQEPPTARVRVVCSAGTYIRTLAQDIGREIGVGAHLTALRRTAAGKFRIEQSVSLNDLENLEDPTSVILKANEAVMHLPSYAVPNERVEKTRSGLSTRIHDAGFHHGEFVRMMGSDGSVIAIGVYESTEKSIRPKIVLI